MTEDFETQNRELAALRSARIEVEDILNQAEEMQGLFRLMFYCLDDTAYSVPFQKAITHEETVKIGRLLRTLSPLLSVMFSSSDNIAKELNNVVSLLYGRKEAASHAE